MIRVPTLEIQAAVQKLVKSQNQRKHIKAEQARNAVKSRNEPSTPSLCGSPRHTVRALPRTIFPSASTTHGLNIERLILAGKMSKIQQNPSLP